MAKLGRNEDIKIAAESLKQLYDEYVGAGFTEKQSFELLKEVIRTGVK